MKNDDPMDGEGHEPQDDNEIPEIYSVSDADGQPTFSRRTFLEIAAMAAGTAALSSTGCATTRGGGGSSSGPAMAHKKPITALAVNAAGNLLASADSEGTIKLWQLPHGALLSTWQGHSRVIVGLACTKVEDALWSLDSMGTLKRWRLPEGKEITGAKFAHSGSMFAVPGNADWYAVKTGKGGVELRSQVSGETVASPSGLDDTVNALAATPDGLRLLGGGTRGNLTLWEGPTGTSVRMVNTDPVAVSALSITPDGNFALSAHANGQLRTWQLPQLQQVAKAQSDLGKIFSVAVRPQADLFAASSEKPQIGLWKVAEPEAKPQLLTGHLAQVRVITITPDGSLLISGSDDKTIRLWSLPEGNYLLSLVDLAINYKHIEGMSYKGTDIYGRTITFTLPCGSPIPPGAVCTCNCVPGSLSIPNNHSQRYNTQGYCTCDLICTCNKVCTCQSVGRGGGYSYRVSYWYPN